MYRLLAILVVVGAATASPWRDRMRLDADDAKNEVCYEFYGCFSSEAPWTSSLRPLVALPSRPEEVGTRFLLYTRNSRDDPEELMSDKDALLEFSQFNASRRTVFGIHGWTNSFQSPWMLASKDNMLDREDINYFTVDWRGGARMNYLKAVGNTRLVGAQLARFLDYLERKTGLTGAKVHLVGHSLGGHIAGYAATRFPDVSRITALDPAYPYFENTDIMVRLDSGDAKYVEVIHTNTDGALTLGLGMTSPVGHIDIYPNGGHTQPGCKDELGSLVSSIVDLITLDFDGVIDTWACSHMRVGDFWTQGVKSDCPFVAYPCKDYGTFNKGDCFTSCQNGECALIGVENENYFGSLAPGKYFMHTDSAQNLCLHPSRLTSTVSASQTKIDHGRVSVIIRRSDGKVSDAFTLVQGAIRASDNFAPAVEIPSNFLTLTGEKMQLILHYTRTGLTPGLDPKQLSLDSINIEVLRKDFTTEVLQFPGVTLEAGTDLIVGQL